MKIKRFSELLCVIFGHSWDETGSSECQKHGTKYNEYAVCSSCGVVEHRGPTYCLRCLAEFKSRLSTGDGKL